MRISDVIIQRPDRVSRTRRGFYGAMTAVAWVVFAWLFQPLITLVVWALGGWITYQEVVRQARSVEPLVVLAIAILAVASATALIVWAEYNRQRFTGEKRRTSPGSPRPSGPPDGQVLPWNVRGVLREARVAVVRFDEDGLPLEVVSARP
jgi:biofilm PGA synthesis protein PgaD